MQKIIAISTCFLQKINISSNKPSITIQKFRCTLTNLNTADEVTRIVGMQNIPFNGAGRRLAPHPFLAIIPSPTTIYSYFHINPLCVEYVCIVSHKNM